MNDDSNKQTCPYCGGKETQILQTVQGNQLHCSGCGNTFTLGAIVHASLGARAEVAPAPVLSAAAATGFRCPVCCAPAGQQCAAGCTGAGLAGAVRRAIGMLAMLDPSKVPLAVPAVMGVLNCALEATPTVEMKDIGAALKAAVDAEYPIPDSAHTSVIQRAVDNRTAFRFGWDAARRAPQVERAVVPECDDAAEGLEILDSLIENIEQQGNYSKEATLTFLGQIKQCFAAPVAQEGELRVLGRVPLPVPTYAPFDKPVTATIVGVAQEGEPQVPPAAEVLADEATLYRDLTGDAIAMGFDGIPAALEAMRQAKASAQAVPADLRDAARPQVVIMDGRLELCALDRNGLAKPIAKGVRLPDHWTSALYDFALRTTSTPTEGAAS